MNTNAALQAQSQTATTFASALSAKLVDTIRTNARVLRYLASSLSSTALDYTMLLILNATIGGVFLPVALARVSSCSLNFALNRKVFNARGGIVATAIRYAIMATSVMTMSYLMIQALVSAGMALWMASLTANTSLFIVNYLGQNFFVFGTLADLRTSISDSGRTLRLKGRGVATKKGTGDLLATISVVVPKDLTPEQLDSIKSLADSLDQSDPRAELKKKVSA